MIRKRLPLCWFTPKYVAVAVNAGVDCPVNVKVAWPWVAVLLEPATTFVAHVPLPPTPLGLG